MKKMCLIWHNVAIIRGNAPEHAFYAMKPQSVINMYFYLDITLQVQLLKAG